MVRPGATAARNHDRVVAPDQIAYGYDYSPLQKIPPSTFEFARTYYPYVRFGLAFTLLGDGFFAHEFGDTWHGNDWWYDELDFDLGYPLGPAERVEVGDGPGEDIIVNGGFEAEIEPPWRLWANASSGCQATVTRDTADAAVDSASVKIDITAISGTDWHVSLAQYDRVLAGGAVYELAFWAKADRARAIKLSAQKGSPDWRGYGLSRNVTIGPDWQEYRVSFEATESTTEARIQFFVGQATGTVWLDDVRLYERGPDVYRRAFTNGLAILNASREVQNVPAGTGYERLTGSQAPRFERILDDGDAGFTASGDWVQVTHDSGEWRATGSFFHDWGASCHEAPAAGGEARWALPVDATDTYTITAWWPAAPAATGWSDQATHDVVAGGSVVASATFDQRTGGDEWHAIGVVRLGRTDAAHVRLRCPGGAPCIADALHVRSSARYNDGSPATVVVLQPMDGIVLRRGGGRTVYFPMALFSSTAQRTDAVPSRGKPYSSHSVWKAPSSSMRW